MFSTANTYTLTLPNSEQLVFGPDSSSANWVGLVGSNGITSSIETRDSRATLARLDGEIVGNSYWGTRSIVIDLFLPFTDPAERADALTKLQRVTNLLRADGMLSWTEQNTAATAKQIPVRLQSFPTITHETGPAKAYQIVLVATQPYIEAGGTASTATDKAANTNHTITNAGDWTTYPVIKIWGGSPAVTAFTVSNTTTGQSMVFSAVSILNTDYVEIDTKPNKRLVYKNGTTNYYGNLSINSEFISLQPGNNTLRLDGITGGGTTPPKMDITWRGAWM